MRVREVTATHPTCGDPRRIQREPLSRLETVPAEQIHLVRHGEVFNPQGVLYGRLPGYGLSDLGRQMAQAAADDLASRKRAVHALVSSPLQRTQQSSEPIAAAFGLEPTLDDRVIEPENRFEGLKMHGRESALRDVRNWTYLVNPWEPSWGEPFRSIVTRMIQAMDDAWKSVDDGDVAVYSFDLFGAEVATANAEPGPWTEVAFSVPESARHGSPKRIEVNAPEGTFTSFHYWVVTF